MKQRAREKITQLNKIIFRQDHFEDKLGHSVRRKYSRLKIDLEILRLSTLAKIARKSWVICQIIGVVCCREPSY